MTTTHEIYCCACERKVMATLTTGKEIYPHRPDLSGLPFWRCESCKNYVGCHHKTKNRTAPLGNIPTPALRAARQHIHKILDPLWKGGQFGRKELYEKISDKIGWNYHTAFIKSVDEARKVYAAIVEISQRSRHDNQP